ncbi:Intracisternal A particle-promoted polypeptide [Balamuthia mandrillaris]
MASSSTPTTATATTTKTTIAGSTSDSSPSTPFKPLPFDPRFEDPNHGDLTVVINHCVRFHVHRLVLCLASPVFRSMLEGGMKESCQNQIHLQEDSKHAPAFGQLLSFLYPYEPTEVNADNVQGLLYFADKYQFSSKVKKACEVFLLPQPESWTQLMTAQRYGLKKLLEKQAAWATCNLPSRVGDTSQRLQQLDVDACRLMLDHMSKKLRRLSYLPPCYGTESLLGSKTEHYFAAVKRSSINELLLN